MKREGIPVTGAGMGTRLTLPRPPRGWVSDLGRLKVSRASQYLSSFFPKLSLFGSFPRHSVFFTLGRQSTLRLSPSFAFVCMLCFTVPYPTESGWEPVRYICWVLLYGPSLVGVESKHREKKRVLQPEMGDGKRKKSLPGLLARGKGSEHFVAHIAK